MKELVGKMKLQSSNLSGKMTVKVDLFDNTKIAHVFIFLFKNVGQNLESKISNVSASFEYFFNKSDFVIETKVVSINELKDVFYCLKSNKSPRYDDISFNVIKKCFDSLCDGLCNSFQVV